VVQTAFLAGRFRFRSAVIVIVCLKAKKNIS
jgi:hypothetical protein